MLTYERNEFLLDTLFYLNILIDCKADKNPEGCFIEKYFVIITTFKCNQNVITKHLDVKNIYYATLLQIYYEVIFRIVFKNST